MAYASQQTKAIIREELKKVIPKSWKWSLSIDNHTMVVLKIKSAPVDLLKVAKFHKDETRTYYNVNVYYIKEQFTDDTTSKIFEKHSCCNEI